MIMIQPVCTQFCRSVTKYHATLVRTGWRANSYTLKYLTKTLFIAEFDKSVWTLFLKSLEGMILLQNMSSMTTILFNNFLESNTNVCGRHYDTSLS
jgi:hypothetical protein